MCDGSTFAFGMSCNAGQVGTDLAECVLCMQPAGHTHCTLHVATSRIAGGVVQRCTAFAAAREMGRPGSALPHGPQRDWRQAAGLRVAQCVAAALADSTCAL